ncbi:ROK family protein [Paenibacillus sp. GCM10012307]|uniref:ROK family transcriptional regulator n=1 Tax=Paenibacillus roseus TaxID=2798579 RepID=A0A934MU10_9BACL|nr:ROK family protein [Paenibacillus roseus]MBJ6360612.1 ROK family transcriptional regulator [Paenibacillus roseus]
MHITGDQHLVKKINKSIVLETIKKKSPLSRSQISELTGLHKGTVSSLINELIEEDLVFEIGHGLSSGGRRPVMLLFNQEAGYAIGVNLGVNFILVILTNLQGEVIDEKTTYFEQTSLDVVIPMLIEAIQAMIARAPKTTYGIIGIGIGVPGVLDDKGTILLAPNLGWENVDLHRILTDAFQIPVTIENEANAGAIGEKEFGFGKEDANLIFVSVGIGIGTGILLNGEIYRGASGFSGEMGHFVIETNGKKCKCGSKGCWELYASENALIEQARQFLVDESGDQTLDINTLVAMADSGSARVIHLFNQIGEYIGIGISNIINMFNPELIVIGNRLAVAEKWIKNPIMRIVEQSTFPFIRRQLRISFASPATDSIALGAAYTATKSFFSNTKVWVD